MSLAACSADEGKGGGEAPLRAWTDVTGAFQIDAAFVDYHEGKVTLRRADGMLLGVELSRLSARDRDYVRSKLRAAKPKTETAGTPAPIEKAEAVEKPKTTATATASEPSGRTGPPDPGCPRCRGIGLVPHEKLEAYLHTEGQPKPDPAQSICGRYCPVCQGGNDPARLLEAEAARLEMADEGHKQWEAKLQMRLTRIETHQVVIHAEVPDDEARRVAEAMEAMTHHLQQLTGNLALTGRRPAGDDMFLFAGKEGYELLIAYLEGDERYARVNWDLMRRLAGATIDRITLLARPPTVPLENMAVHGSANRQVQLAAASNSPPWLNEGFAAYCEFKVLKQNLVHSVDAQSADVRLAPNWDVQLRQLARQGKLRTWDEMFAKELAEYEMVHFLESKSMVTFLLQEPAKFQDLVDAFAGGAEAPTALESAYGKPAADLEKEWRRWMNRR